MFLITLANIVDQQILHRHSPSFRIGVLLGEGATQSFQTKPSTNRLGWWFILRR